MDSGRLLRRRANVQALRVGALIGLLLTGVNSIADFAFASHPDSERPNYSFEFLTFKAAAPNQTLLEVFCQIPSYNLNFTKSGNRYVASFNISMTLFNRITWEAMNLSHTDSVSVPQLDNLPELAQSQIIRFAFSVAPGEYLATIKLTDDQPFEYFSFDRSVSIPDYGTGELEISALQISTAICKATRDSELVKNNMRITPNVDHVFGYNDNALYIYSEVYGLSPNMPKSTQEFMATYAILDHVGNEAKTGTHTINKPGATCMLAMGIPIADLEAGPYKLLLSVRDLATSEKANSSADFTVTRPFGTDLPNDILGAAVPPSNKSAPLLEE